MNLNELAAELKEVTLKLNQVKHYVTKNNIPLPDGMPPILALMLDHTLLDLWVRNLTTALTKVSEHNARMGHDIKEMSALLVDINEYCQQNNIGTIGDSSSKALMTHHKALIEGKLVPVYQCREIGETDWLWCDLQWYQHCQKSPEHATRIIYIQVAPLGTPLGGCAVKDPSKCRIETNGECGCAFGQCANGLVF